MSPDLADPGSTHFSEARPASRAADRDAAGRPRGCMTHRSGPLYSVTARPIPTPRGSWSSARAALRGHSGEVADSPMSEVTAYGMTRTSPRLPATGVTWNRPTSVGRCGTDQPWCRIATTHDDIRIVRSIQCVLRRGRKRPHRTETTRIVQARTRLRTWSDDESMRSDPSAEWESPEGAMSYRTAPARIRLVAALRTGIAEPSTNRSPEHR
jgi:hypothetical protein